MRINHCRVCAGRELTPFLDLGNVALANRFLRTDELAEPEPCFPLRAVFCPDCGLVQIDEEVPREVLFKNYLYVSGTSDLVHQHAERIATTLCDRYSLNRNSLIVEAASNDGTVLRAFQKRRVRILGVEPAENIAATANAADIPTLCDFFDEASARRIHADRGPANIFLARHVLAHVADLHGFVRGIKHLLAPDGIGVVEVPHVAELYHKLEYDTIYHEHLCYFSLAVLRTLFEKHGLRLIDVDRVPLHGGSLLVQLGHDYGPHLPTAQVDAVLHAENELGLSRLQDWQHFAERVSMGREMLLGFLDGLIKKGYQLAGYGASAKGNTLLSYCGIGPDRLAFVADRSSLKQGLFTPGRHIPVCDPDRLLREQPDVTLLLAWNFADEIVAQQRRYCENGGRFAVPIPEPGFYGVAA